MAHMKFSMLALSLFPGVALLQVWHELQNGYWRARSPDHIGSERSPGADSRQFQAHHPRIGIKLYIRKGYPLSSS
jgi:hypothetical protein